MKTNSHLIIAVASLVAATSVISFAGGSQRGSTGINVPSSQLQIDPVALLRRVNELEKRVDAAEKALAQAKSDAEAAKKDATKANIMLAVVNPGLANLGKKIEECNGKVDAFHSEYEHHSHRLFVGARKVDDDRFLLATVGSDMFRIVDIPKDIDSLKKQYVQK